MNHNMMVMIATMTALRTHMCHFIRRSYHVSRRQASSNSATSVYQCILMYTNVYYQLLPQSYQMSSILSISVDILMYTIVALPNYLVATQTVDVYTILYYVLQHNILSYYKLWYTTLLSLLLYVQHVSDTSASVESLKSSQPRWVQVLTEGKGLIAEKVQTSKIQRA